MEDRRLGCPKMSSWETYAEPVISVQAVDGVLPEAAVQRGAEKVAGAKTEATVYIQNKTATLLKRAAVTISISGRILILPPHLLLF